MHDHETELPDLPGWKTIAWVAAGFLAVTLLIYGWSLGNAFVRWDDGMLIYENPAVRTIAPWSIKRIFTSYDPELYIPLTFLSYQIDYLIGGIDPFIYHLTNLLLHTANALLVAGIAFLLLKRKWTALFVGLLFAVHPLHTEAVEWASARKDVLSTFFFLLSIWGYLRSRETGGRAYKWSVVAFLLGLMSKVMVITLPVVLVLLDLQRGRKIGRAMLLDKLPYLALAVVFGVIGLFGKEEVVASSTLLAKILMACKSAVFYLQQILFPTRFSLLYPYTGQITLSSPDFLVPVAVLTALLAVAVVSLRKTRDVAFALAFYLVTVAPTFLNFAKGGDLDIYFASDRYAYIPSIGVFLLLGFLVARVLPEDEADAPRVRRLALLGCGAAALLGLSIFAYRQSLVWADTESLFRNVLVHYPESSYVAHNNIGNVYRLQGDMEKAIEEYEQALKIREHPKTLSNLGAAYRRQGKIEQALATYRRALALKADSTDAHFGLGIVYNELRQFPEAEKEYRAAIASNPTYARAYVNLGSVLQQQGRLDEAAEILERSVDVDPYLPEAWYNYGVVLGKQGKLPESAAVYERAVELDPGSIAARLNLAIAYYSLGSEWEADAIEQFRTVLRLDPDNRTARSALQQIGAQ